MSDGAPPHRPGAADQAVGTDAAHSPDEAAADAPGLPGRPTEASRLAADPAAYDSERNEHARKRGLAAPYIAGGRDPDPEGGRSEERRLLRWLVLMVIAIVASGFVIGIIGNILAPG